MCLPKSMHALQKEKECLKAFFLIGFYQFFRMPPCDIDARSCHELLMTLQEDGTCMLSDQEGEPIELNLAQDIVVKALTLQEGNHVISSTKLTSSERWLAFTHISAHRKGPSYLFCSTALFPVSLWSVRALSLAPRADDSTEPLWWERWSSS